MFWYTWPLIYGGSAEHGHDTEFNNAELRRGEVRRRAAAHTIGTINVVERPLVRDYGRLYYTAEPLLERNAQSAALSVDGCSYRKGPTARVCSIRPIGFASQRAALEPSRSRGEPPLSGRGAERRERGGSILETAC